MTHSQTAHRARLFALGLLAGAGALAASLAFTSTSGAAATETVTNLNDSGSGSLRQAITDVNSGGTINFAASLAGTITLESSLEIDKSLTISGPGADKVTLDGQAEFRHLLIGNSTQAIDVTISGLKLFRGYDSGSGGSIRSLVDDSLTVRDVVFRSNTSDSDGGAVALNGSGDATFDNVTATMQAADSSGGVIYSDSGGKLTIKDSLFQKNSAYGYAGFLYLEPGAAGDLVSITDTEIINNGSADDYSGAAYFGVNTGNVTADNNLWANNFAYSGYGGAFYADVDTANHTWTDTNSEYIGNNSYDYAGAIYSDGTTAFTFENSLFDSNFSGSDEGGAISLNDAEQLTIKRSVFTANQDPYYGAVIDLASNGNRNHVIEDTSFVNASGGNSYSIGGLNLDDGSSATYTLTNVTVAGNVGSGSNSAAVDIGEGDATLDHVTIANNVGGGAGSSSSAAGLSLNSNTSATVRNSIIAGNVYGGGVGSGYPQDCYVDGTASLTLEEENIIGIDTDPTSCPYSGPAPISGDAGLREDPALVPFLGAEKPGYTYVLPLKANSPAIDAATGSSPAKDGRGVPRPQLAAADLGAYEWAPKPTVKIVSSSANQMQVKVGCGTSLKGCTLKISGSRNLKGRVSPVEASSVKVTLGAGQKKTVTISYTAKMEKFVRRGVRKHGRAKIAASALNTATKYKGTTTAKTSG